MYQIKQKGDTIHKWGRPTKNGDFTGRVFFSTLDGHFTRGLRYKNGVVTALILNGHYCAGPEQTRLGEIEESNCRNFSLCFFKEPTTRSDWEGYTCLVCGKFIRWEDTPCHEVDVHWCRTCNRLKDECVCCDLCNSYPCICFDCPECGRDYTRCICGLCSECGNDPCSCLCCDCDGCNPLDPDCHCCPECRSETGEGQITGDGESTGGGNSGGNTGGDPGSSPGGNPSVILPQVQIDYEESDYSGYIKGDCNCMCVSRKIMFAILGANANIGSSATAVQLWKEINEELTLVGSGEDVFDILNNHINGNRPIIVGINHSVGHPGNLDKTTDHFVVVVGRGYDVVEDQYYYTYIETAYGSENHVKACDYQENRLYYDKSKQTFRDESPYDPRRNNRIYTLTQVRPNF